MMRELSIKETEKVSGAWVLVAVGIVGAYIGGYIAGRQAKEKRLSEESDRNYQEYCRDNPDNCA